MYHKLLTDHSSKALHVTELIQLVSYLNMQTDTLPVFQHKCCTPSQAWKITTMWEQKARDKSEHALLSFCKRITKRECESIASLRVDEAKNILIALQKLQ
ncbi:phage protein GemA/Gp16 family protein [Sulfurospirillum cavolei]|uniref:phage protein GemA/Gp16 family protein n=1 Tax=Sulfurospirillum cavolei TaxID=366522 RepID=UPI003D7BD92F